jgi:uncharacterized membrane protein YsdA (DUF1294 family)
MQRPRDNRFSRSRGVTAPVIVLLILLLVAPGYALSRLTTWIDWRVLVAAPIIFSAITFFAYRSDKRRAEAGEWRIPESTLHFAELIGGWPGALLAQRQFRHKTSKVSFQVAFWFIVLIHQFVAVDSLVGWRFTKDALRFIQPKTSNVLERTDSSRTSYCKVCRSQRSSESCVVDKSLAGIFSPQMHDDGRPFDSYRRAWSFICGYHFRDP